MAADRADDSAIECDLDRRASELPNHYALDGIAHVPISDLPPSETAIVWLSTNRSEIAHAFAQVAADVLGPGGQ
jgi:hypothetical protein